MAIVLHANLTEDFTSDVGNNFENYGTGTPVFTDKGIDLGYHAYDEYARWNAGVSLPAVDKENHSIEFTWIPGHTIDADVPIGYGIAAWGLTGSDIFAPCFMFYHDDATSARIDNIDAFFIGFNDNEGHWIGFADYDYVKFVPYWLSADSEIRVGISVNLNDPINKMSLYLNGDFIEPTHRVDMVPYTGRYAGQTLENYRLFVGSNGSVSGGYYIGYLGYSIPGKISDFTLYDNYSMDSTVGHTEVFQGDLSSGETELMATGDLKQIKINVLQDCKVDIDDSGHLMKLKTLELVQNDEVTLKVPRDGVTNLTADISHATADPAVRVEVRYVTTV